MLREPRLRVHDHPVVQRVEWVSAVDAIAEAIVAEQSLQALWPRVWALASKEDARSDGTAVWYIATQCGAEQLTAPAQAALAATQGKQ